MNNSFLQITTPKNEAILQYAPASMERQKLEAAIQQLKASPTRIASYISGAWVASKHTSTLRAPHDLSCVLGEYSPCTEQDIDTAIAGALKARDEWAAMPWVQRASIFLKAADLIAGKYRYAINAATMLGQSKTAIQAEIDSACELIDFLRFNVFFLNEIYKQQPLNDPPAYNRLEYRPLEGFVLAISPFNFTAIAGNLCTAPAMCGNVVIWKAANTQLLSASIIVKVLQEAGLPDGVIQFVIQDGPLISKKCIEHPSFAGLHFTGSTSTFNTLWKTIASQLDRLNTYPRIVGETGGKDFVFVHPSADVDIAVNALLRGAYEYQGQKCSAASRAYIPSSLADKVLPALITKVKSLKVGSVEDFSNFMAAVIDEKSFDRIASYIEKVKQDPACTILAGGKYSKQQGYFIEPTLVQTKDAQSLTMCEEIFGPVLTVFVYEDKHVDATLSLVNNTSPYALTGSIIAQDRNAIIYMTEKLCNAAGNFYINDKPTGAVVGQQPFGGTRKSGTNDKAGSHLNLLRWLSPRTIKENTLPPTEHSYPHMG